MPVIGQGTWDFPTTQQQIADAIKSVRAGIELGMTHIDTAEMYGDGRSEEIIGDAIAGLPRERLFIVSKVLPSHATYEGTIRACEQSLKRLRLDYLDCYLLHWRESIPLQETIRGLERLIDDGKIRSMGVSNFDVYDMEEALAISSKPIACNQILYNLYTRGPEHKLIPFCAKKNIAVVAYTPFAQKNPEMIGTECGGTLERIAKKFGATVAQIILAFLVREDNVFTIPKATNLQHINNNAAASQIKLSESDIDEIEQAYPAPNKEQPLKML